MNISSPSLTTGDFIISFFHIYKFYSYVSKAGIISGFRWDNLGFEFLFYFKFINY